MIYRRAAKDAETNFPFAVDLPSLKLWQGKDAGKGRKAKNNSDSAFFASLR